MNPDHFTLPCPSASLLQTISSTGMPRPCRASRPGEMNGPDPRTGCHPSVRSVRQAAILASRFMAESA